MPIKKTKKPPVPYPETEEKFVFPDGLDNIYHSSSTMPEVKKTIKIKKKNELSGKHREDNKTSI